MQRRRFLIASAASAFLAGCSRFSFIETPPTIHYPGMNEGHLLRDREPLPPPSAEVAIDVAILGSGVAGLTAAWKLSKEGFHRFLVLDGPEFGGNTTGGHFGELAFPRGAHYVPLPSRESVHVREMLSDFGILQGDPASAAPYFDETAVVHAPEGRVYYGGKWQVGVLPSEGVPAEEMAEHNRFFDQVETFKIAKGADGKKAFCIPIEQSSADPRWVELDRISFKQWLTQQGYTSQTLHWYLNYACRDDYGAPYDRVSAWAGLHYFASRAGHARNAGDGAVLTWPDGLNALVRRMANAIDRRQQSATAWRQPGFAARVEERHGGADVLCVERTSVGPRTFVIHAKRVVCAMPLFVAARVLSGIGQYGFDASVHMPSYAPWLVSNFLMRRFPPEQAGAPLSWDNVLHGGRGLGYVVSTHQDIRVARPPKTVFSAYQALSDQAPREVRRWLAQASPHELYEEAACDLREVYGLRFPLHTESLDITVRAHAMASPLTGFLKNRGLTALRNSNGRILFAHSDLSGFSVFEEAAWWGHKAALRLLG